MRQFRSFAASFTFAGLVFSAVLATAAVTVGSEPAGAAAVYCTYVGYPHGCVARPGGLWPRPVARTAVRHHAGGNLNGGVNRIGARR